MLNKLNHYPSQMMLHVRREVVKGEYVLYVVVLLVDCVVDFLLCVSVYNDNASCPLIATKLCKLIEGLNSWSTHHINLATLNHFVVVTTVPHPA